MKKGKMSKIVGWILLVFVFLEVIVIFSSFFEWKSKESEYTKQFVYSSSGNLYYEKDDEKIYVETIYNTDNELIELNIPDKETVIMYSSKENPQECIYFEMDNTLDQSILNPFVGMITPLFVFAVAFYLISNSKIFLSRIYFCYVFFFALGLGFSIWQSSNLINYLDLKNNNNIVEATIYSEIYTIIPDNDVYKPVSYYYVDNQKYLYADDSYISGSLEENLGKTFE